jgi:hypothetical protein
VSEPGRIRRFLQGFTGVDETPLDGDTPAWFISLMIHLLLLVAFSLFFFRHPQQRSVVLSSAPIEDEIIEEELPTDFAVSEVPEEKIGADSHTIEDGAALSQAAVLDEISDPITPPEITETGEFSIDAPAATPTGIEFNQDQFIPGSTGVGTTGAVGAIDWITQRVLESLDERETLVVWMFDSSVSLALQREEVRKKFDTIYRELGVIEANGAPVFEKYTEKPLLTVVGSFGEKVEFLTPRPTDDLQEIKDAVQNIQIDRNGIENVFKAVGSSVDRYKRYRTTSNPHRNVMVVVFTDEVGDDVRDLESTIRKCRNAAVPVYVVGVPAPFGRAEVEIKYIDPDPKYDQTPQWGRVNQGPESLAPERLKIQFAGNQQAREVPIDSGFGPFALCRMCYETGGAYLSVHPNRKTGSKINRWQVKNLSSHMEYFFDPEVMRSYAPQYFSVSKYKKMLQDNPARKALVQAAQQSWLAPVDKPRLVFPKRSDAQLAQTLFEAQKSAAKLTAQVDRVHRILEPTEAAGKELINPRWKAGYALAMGRILAIKIRTEGYNAMLAKAKRGMKFTRKSDTWLLKPADEFSTGSTLAKNAAKAKEYLTRVIDDHPGTPWALLAKRELSSPLGWTWDERYDGINEPRRPAANNNNNNRPRNDDMKRKLQRKPKRKVPPL